MTDLILRVYDTDDTTEAWQVGTAAAHANPYLHVPETYAEAEVDPREGSARIARLSVRVADPQTGVDQTERFLTALLGSADGYSTLNGRRLRLEHATGELVIDGMGAGAKLGESFAGFELAIDDVRARGIKVPLFNRTGTSTVLPRGVLNGYGDIPGGDWLVPPSAFLTGTYTAAEAVQGYIDFRTHGQYAERVITEAMRTASLPAFDQATGRLIYPDVEVWWRPTSFAEPWRVHARMEAPVYTFGTSPQSILAQKDRLFLTIPGTFRDADDKQHDVDYASRLFLRATADQPTMPTNGQEVWVMVVYVGPASEAYPFHFEGTAGELLRNIWRGDYSEDEHGNALDPRLRYDEAVLVGAGALPALARPVRLRVTEPEPDLREFTDRICKALGVAPALDSDGQISPISEELPDETVALPELNDSNCQPLPGWEHPISGAVTQVEMTYARDYRVPAESDPLGLRSSGDSIQSAEQRVTIRPQDHGLSGTIQATMGVQVLEIDGFLWRAAGGEQGQPSVPQIESEAGYQHALRRGVDAIQRWAYGGQTSLVRAMNIGSVAALRVGDWVLDARSWAPNYATGARGRNHLAQVVSVRDLNPAWREMRLVDAAPHANPVTQPTLGVLAENDPGIVTVPVSDIPVGGAARVDHAVSDTLPANEDGAWTCLGRLDAAGSLTTPALPAGSVVWFRARGEEIGRRPSAWTNADSITLAAEARVIRAWLVIEASGDVVVHADVSALTLGVRIYYAVHVPGADPGILTESQDFDASDGEWALQGVTLEPGQAITVEVEPWDGWNGSAVTGTAGTRAYATASTAADDSAYRLRNFNVQHNSDGTSTVTWEMGARLEETHGAYLLTTEPETPAKWTAVRAAVEPVTSPWIVTTPVETGGVQQLGLLRLEGRYEDPASGAYLSGRAIEHTITPKTSIPAIDDDTGELAASAISSRKQFAAAMPVFMPVNTVADLPADNTDADYVLVLEDGSAYEWDAATSGWEPYTDTPAIAIYPALTAAIVKAYHVQLDSLSELSDDLGIILSGVLRNAAATAGIRLDAADTLPGTMVDFLDLAATGADPILQVGGLRILANGDTLLEDEVAKTIRVSHHGFRPVSNTEQYTSALNNTTITSGTGTDAEFAFPLFLPEGAEITSLRLRGSLGTIGNVSRVILYRQTDAGTNTNLEEVSIVNTAAETRTENLATPEVVDGQFTYLLYVLLDYASGTAPSFHWVEVDYTSHSTRETL